MKVEMDKTISREVVEVEDRMDSLILHPSSFSVFMS